MSVRPVPLGVPGITQIELQWKALKGHPNEVCGYISKYGNVVELPNTFAGDRKHGFDMEVDLDEPIAAFWHSHPSGPGYPSKDDIPAMELLASHGFKFPWLIVAPGSITNWQFDERI